MLRTAQAKKKIIRYLEKQGGGSLHISSSINPLTQLIVVIPAYHETELGRTLKSLEACSKPASLVEVIIVLNSSDKAPSNIKAFHEEQFKSLSDYSGNLIVHPVLLIDIPSKISGVGYGRKSGMDEAAHRLASHHADDGIIVCLDGDCEVSTNYFDALISYFSKKDAKQAVHLSFEHRLPVEVSLREAIISYELHLRLLKYSLSQAGHPQAFHAVGSCMAVQAWAYAAQGGMNNRQAGEDFYFIHKFSKIGQLEELTNATVYPSSRISHRVPFGTGAAVGKVMKGEEQLTYNPASFEIIKTICSSAPKFYTNKKLALDLFKGFHSETIVGRIEEIISNTTSVESFTKRFFNWFDAFRIIKFLHYLREMGHEDMPVSQAYDIITNSKTIPHAKNCEEQLTQLKVLEYL